MKDEPVKCRTCGAKIIFGLLPQHKSDPFPEDRYYPKDPITDEPHICRTAEGKLKWARCRHCEKQISFKMIEKSDGKKGFIAIGTDMKEHSCPKPCNKCGVKIKFVQADDKWMPIDPATGELHECQLPRSTKSWDEITTTEVPEIDNGK